MDIARQIQQASLPAELPQPEGWECAVQFSPLREVGGDAAEFISVGAVLAWVSTALRLIDERANDPARWSARRSDGFGHAAKFSWSEYARRYVELYRQIAAA